MGSGGARVTQPPGSDGHPLPRAQEVGEDRGGEEEGEFRKLNLVTRSSRLGKPGPVDPFPPYLKYWMDPVITESKYLQDSFCTGSFWNFESILS